MRQVIRISTEEQRKKKHYGARPFDQRVRPFRAEIKWFRKFPESPFGNNCGVPSVSFEFPLQFPVSGVVFFRGCANGKRAFYRPLFFVFFEKPFHSTRKMFEISNRFLVVWRAPPVSIPFSLFRSLYSTRQRDNFALSF